MARRRTLAAVLIALGLLCGAGCDPSPATQLVVVVDSDLRVPEELATVRARTVGPDGETVSEQRFELAASPDDAGEARFTLPLSFGLVPREDDVDRRVEIRLAGFAPAGDEPLVRRRAVTGFVKGASLALPMFLARSCVGTTCPGEQTCSRTGCVDPQVPAGELVHVDPGGELSILDGGASDAGDVDAGDGGIGDGGIRSCPSSCDDGCIERECTTGETCECADEPCNCRLSCPSSGCETRCSRSACVVDGRGSDAVDVDCDAARCTVDCHGASSCEVSCAPGSDCLVLCGEGDSCRITDCTGMQRECAGDGGVMLVCGRACP